MQSMQYTFGTLITLLTLVLAGCTYQDWRTADRSSVGLAPSPDLEKDAVVLAGLQNKVNRPEQKEVNFLRTKLLIGS